ncbi:hypothetical protein J4207_03705 [Candidatus Woesearchaeota archaeon]|nr:hypothetical protein [Candidatus Woesearchaeota archaeon]
MKCELCKATLSQLFLGKINGTYVKDEKGKKHLVCFDCQKKFPSKTEVLEQLKKSL